MIFVFVKYDSTHIDSIITNQDGIEIYECGLGIYYHSRSYNHPVEENQWCGHVNDPLFKIVNLVQHNDSILLKVAHHF